MTLRRGLLALTVGVAVSACGNPTDQYPGQVSTHFDGDKQLVLVAGYSAAAQSIGIVAWADVHVGTPALVEVTGPLHVLCDGVFEPVPSNLANPGGRPALDVGDGTEGAQFHAPSGRYRAVVSVPSVQARIEKSFDAGQSAADAVTGVWDLPERCVPVADTRRQLAAMRATYVGAIGIWVGRIDDPSVRTRLDPLAAKARDALASGDTTMAIADVIAIRQAVDPSANRNHDYDIARDCNAALALLRQAPPAS